MSDLPIAGYTDRLSVRPGESIRVMVSADVPYRADVVRLISGESARDGSGFREEVVAAIPASNHPGRRQPYHLGSYGIIPVDAAFAPVGPFTVTCFLFPTTPGRRRQALLATNRWQLAIDPAGGLVFAAGATEAHTGVPLPASRWVFVAASVDPARGEALLVQRPVPIWPAEPAAASVRRALVVPESHLARHGAPAPLLLAARPTADGPVDLLNGRLDRPRIIGAALDEADLARLALDVSPAALGMPVVADWDFAQEIAGDRIVDTGPRGRHGRLVNLPTRAVTDHTWTGREHDWRLAPETYAAIHFHDDDLEDAGWAPDFTLDLPSDLPSGIYAARLIATAGMDGPGPEPAQDHVPFFVRAPAARATAPLLFLQSTNTHLAYANWHLLISDEMARQRGYPAPYPLQPEQRYAIANNLLSLYDHHSDGTGVCYSSRLRPIVNMRPKMNDQSSPDGIGYAHGLKADLQLAGWLTDAGFDYDIATDEDLHADGLDLLASYRTVLTGTHPEYWSEAMLDAAEAYLAGGGRLMYLGGNGFYWVTSFDTARPHVIEVRRSNGSRAWSANVGEYHHSTTGEMGGLWRERGRAPQRLAGVGFAGQGGGRAQPYRRTAAAADPRAAWIFEGVGAESVGSAGLVMDGAAGFEIDRADHALGTPPHALVVATATGFSDLYQHAIEEVPMSNSLQGGTIEPRVRADMVFFETPNGGAVFSVGSIAYAGSLLINAGDNDIARITANVLRRFLDPR
ncbi:MAG: LamG domain-containing protein, partial [Chloroflexi bacterium]|nr:LamG domain-containing protein [Chloroflexota bacterium]